MIRVYYLEVERIDNTETVKGIEFIHDAILEVEDSLRKLIQDTTDGEHAGLVAVCVSWRQATDEEIALLATLPISTPPSSTIFHSPAVFEPPTLEGVAHRVEYIETFLKALYP